MISTRNPSSGQVTARGGRGERVTRGVSASCTTPRRSDGGRAVPKQGCKAEGETEARGWAAGWRTRRLQGRDRACVVSRTGTRRRTDALASTSERRPHGKGGQAEAQGRTDFGKTGNTTQDGSPARHPPGRGDPRDPAKDDLPTVLEGPVRSGHRGLRELNSYPRFTILGGNCKNEKLGQSYADHHFKYIKKMPLRDC